MRKIIFIICAIILIASIVYMMIYRFSNPDMTTTRIFINRWYVQVISLACAYYCAYYLNEN